MLSSPGDDDSMGVDCLPGRGSDFNAGIGSLVMTKKSGEEDDDFEDDFDTTGGSLFGCVQLWIHAAHSYTTLC